MRAVLEGMAKTSGSRRGAATRLFDNSTRFNWGKHDAIADREAGRRPKDELWLSRHFDKHYAEGYREGKYQS
jgi:hypothetical protein